MKKTIMLLLCILCTFQTFAQLDREDDKGKNTFKFSDLPFKNDQIVYERVITLDSTFPKDKLYKSAKMAVINSFRDSKSVIQLDDKDNGKIICKGIATGHYKYAMVSYNIRWHFTMDITVKEGKYRIQIYDFDEWEWTSHLLTSSTPWDNFTLGRLYTRQAMKGHNPGLIFYKTVNDETLSFIDNIEAKMKGKSINDSDF